MSDVFLSHSSTDKDRVSFVADALRDAGLTVWFDAWMIKPGDDIYLALEHALHDSRIVLLFLSRAALSSDWVSLERSATAFRDPINRRRRLIPVLLEDCEIPEVLSRLRYVDLRKNQPSELALLVTTCRESARGDADTVDQLVAYRQQHTSFYTALVAGRPRLELRASFRDGPVSDALSSITAWINNPKAHRLIVLGEPGSGKTQLLRRVAHELAHSGAALPIFIQVGSLRNRPLASVAELLAHSDPKMADEKWVSHANVIVFLDGLDELIGPLTKNQIDYATTLEAIGAVLPAGCRLIMSCRGATFEAIGGAVERAIRPHGKPSGPIDLTEVALWKALGASNLQLDFLWLQEVTKRDSIAFLEQTLPAAFAHAPAAEYILEHLPRVPVVLRLLQVALPELQGVREGVELDQLYSVALRTWIFRDPIFAECDNESVWDKLIETPNFGSHEFSQELVAKLKHIGLLKTSQSLGRYRWAHLSIGEFLMARRLLEDLKRFDATTLSGLDLIGAYNINRFLVPMCRRYLPVSRKPAERLVPVTARRYLAFVNATGWRQKAGYGHHPSYIADDGTGYVSGNLDLKSGDYVEPNADGGALPITALSWYDAFAYCYWAREAMPTSEPISAASNALGDYWFWRAQWSDERKAHVAVGSANLVTTRLADAGVNPDFRHRKIGLATLH